MESKTTLNLALLLALGTALAAGNVWISAARSTIPLTLKARVADTEMRREKHPGEDDVFLVHLEDGRTLQVDRNVAEIIRPGDHLEKDRWSRTLRVRGQPRDLHWSQDFRGMLVVMPTITFALAVTSLLLWFSKRERAPMR